MVEQNPQKQVEGPPMICATHILRPGGTRVGRIAGNLSLPRTIPLTSALAAAAGALIMLVPAFIFFPTLQGYLYSLILGAAAGYMITTYSPMKGESFTKWLGLTVKNTTSRTKIDGVPMTVAVGTARAGRNPENKVIIKRACIPVSPGSVDERGSFK